MVRSSQVLREIRKIRLAKYNAEKDLSPEELKAKRAADYLEIEKTMKEYGLKWAEVPLKQSNK